MKENNISFNISCNATWTNENVINILLILLLFFLLLAIDPFIAQEFLKLLLYLLN